MSNKNVSDYIKKDTIELNLKSKNKNSVIKEMYENLKKTGLILNEEQALKDLYAREEMGTTGIGRGVALPHAKTDSVSELVLTIGICKDGIEYSSIDESKVNILFMFLCPQENTQEYLKVLARISRLIRNDDFRNNLLKAKSSEEIFEIIEKEES